MDYKLLKIASINSFLVLAYVILIVWIMQMFEKSGSDFPSPWTPVAFLMLLTLSAAIVGTLIFARPVMIFLEGGKKEAVKLLAYTLGCLIILTILAIVIVAPLG